MENINDIISPEGERQLDNLVDKLQKAQDELVKFGATAKTISLDFKGAKDLSGFAEVQERLATNTKNMTTAQEEYAKIVQEAAQLIKQHNGHSKEHVAVMKGLAETDLKAAKAATEQGKARRENARAMVDEERAAKLKRQETERETKALSGLNNEYIQLKKLYNETSLEAKRLAVAAENVGDELGKQSVEYKTLAAQAKDATDASFKMYQTLLKVEMAVGQGQRQVGQYNQAAFAMQQVLRELPAFSFSFATGISAISNNIPILIDEVKKLKIANEELKASGGKSIPVWKTLASSIFSWQTALLVGITALISYSSRASAAEKQTKKLADANEEYTNSLRETDKAAKQSAASEQSKLNILVKAAQNTALAMDERVAAVEELQKLYPDYLGNLTQEKILTGDIAAELEDLNKAIVARSMMTAVGDKITKEYEKIIAAEGELNRIREKTRPGVGANAAPQAFFYDKDERVQRLNDEISTAKENIDQYNRLVDEYALAAGKLAVTKQDNKGGNGLTPGSNSLTGAKELAEAESNLRKQELQEVANQQKAIADDEKRSINDRIVASQVYHATRVQQARAEYDESQKVEEEAIKESLRRIEDLQQKKREILAGKGNMSASQRTEAVNNIDAQLKDEEQKQEAHYVKALASEMKYEAETTQVLIDATNDRAKITKSGNEVWLSQQADAYTKSKLDQLIAYQTDIELLKKQYANKEITRKQYAQRLRELEHRQHLIELDAQVEYDKRLLENDQLTAQQKLDIREKLIADQKALDEAAAKDVSARGKVRGGRITDGVANLLGGADLLKADLDQQQRYYQTFYDNVMNIAVNAANAIKAAQQAKFDAEAAQLDRQQEAIRAGYQFELEAIGQSSAAEADKQNMISQLRGQQQAQEAQYEAKRKQLAQQQARFQRTAALASAISNTAVAITKALAELGPLAAIAIPLIAASGAAQIATIASAPVPQYAEGTLNHPGGRFIAGDGNEIEYIKAPGKPGYWSAPTPTMYNEPKGTTVTPLSKFDSVDVKSGLQYAGHDGIAYSYLANLIGDKFDESNMKLAQVVAAHGYREQKQQDFAAAARALATLQGM